MLSIHANLHAQPDMQPGNDIHATFEHCACALECNLVLQAAIYAAQECTLPRAIFSSSDWSTKQLII